MKVAIINKIHIHSSHILLLYPVSYFRGYEGLVRNLMSELPAGVVSYNQPVRCIHWNNSDKGDAQVNVECHDGKVVAADHVIVTVPLGRITLQDLSHLLPLEVTTVSSSSYFCLVRLLEEAPYVTVPSSPSSAQNPLNPEVWLWHQQ